MRFVSTTGHSSGVDLNRALRQGPAPDGGLYMPEILTPGRREEARLPASTLQALSELSWNDLASAAARHLLGDALPEASLRRLVAEALDFPIPLRHLEEDIYILELFHGPTLAFKDVGARFLARLLASLPPLGESGSALEGSPMLTVLVATSGDTGGAVARAFHGVAGTRVAVLYPHGKVSALQERQFATLGGNVRAFAVEGTFDDCQRLVKNAFTDSELSQRLQLTSANSINVGRLLPQVFYHLWGVAQLNRMLEADGRRIAGQAMPAPVICVPSGNFGNLTAGLVAARLGLPVRRFVAATNINDVVPEYLRTGLYAPRPSQCTLSTAMDVGDPSNLARMTWLYADDLDAMRRDVIGSAHDDAETQQAILEIEKRTGQLLDPHTAVGYLGLREALADAPPGTPGIVLATAHPAKFCGEIEPFLGRSVELPAALTERLDARLLQETLENDSAALRERLLDWPENRSISVDEPLPKELSVDG